MAGSASGPHACSPLWAQVPRLCHLPLPSLDYQTLLSSKCTKGVMLCFIIRNMYLGFILVPVTELLKPFELLKS